MSTQVAQHPAGAPAAVSPERIEELGRIIMAYSEVTEKLQEAHERLEQRVRTLLEELSEKNRQLERRNRLAALGEMAAGMAHEIRNPLGGIQLYASMLAKDVQDRPESAAVVGKIAGGVKRLESLVGQVLQFTREMRANIAEMDLAGVVNEAVELAGGSSVKVDGPRSLNVMADQMLIGQAALNLIRNAMESVAETHGQVAVRYGGAKDSIEVKQFWLVVEDSGPGIPAGVMDKIFNPFFTTKDQGTGLGLAIVHRIVEAHEGTIVVTNRVGGGARFEIRI
jgi:signal transduction histidine kinase